MASHLAGGTQHSVHCTAAGLSRRLHSSRSNMKLVVRPRLAANAAADQQQVSAEVVVQRQLEAYNARDVEAFMDLLSGKKAAVRDRSERVPAQLDDCVASDAGSGAVLGSSKEELRKRYEARFQTEVHSELLGRLCLGNVVVDREIITGLPNAEVADCLATYYCEGGKIQRMAFVWQPRWT